MSDHPISIESLRDEAAAERRQHLAGNHHFTCTCEECLGRPMVDRRHREALNRSAEALEWGGADYP